MSIPAVVELSQEIRRLAIAGSDLAIGDARLSAIVPVLQSNGAKVPVFAKIADKLSALLESDRESAPAYLLQLNVLTVAVLKTQGRAGVEGDLAALPSHEAPINDEATVAVVHSLTENESDQALLTDALTAKKRAIRVAAMRRLLMLDDDAASDRCIKMLEGSSAKAREALDSTGTLTTPEMRNAVRNLIATRLDLICSDKTNATETSVLISSLHLLFDGVSEHDAEDLELALSVLHRCEAAWRLAFKGGTKLPVWQKMQTAENGKSCPIEVIIGYLLAHSAASDHQELLPLALTVAPGSFVIAAIKHLGPRPAWALLAPMLRRDIKRHVSGALEGDWPSHNDRLPEAAHWNIEWFAEAIRCRNFVLINHLYEYFMKNAHDQAQKLFLKGIDDWCVFRLLDYLESDSSVSTHLLISIPPDDDQQVHFDSLRSAMFASEVVTALSILEKLFGRGCRAWPVLALNMILMEHFA